MGEVKSPMRERRVTRGSTALVLFSERSSPGRDSIVSCRTHARAFGSLAAPAGRGVGQVSLGPFACGGGYGGAGCLGAGRIARETTVAAIVWDLERGRESKDLVTTERANDLLVGAGLPRLRCGRACNDRPAGSARRVHVVFCFALTARLGSGQ